jgi:hypothetical protein
MNHFRGTGRRGALSIALMIGYVAIPAAPALAQTTQPTASSPASEVEALRAELAQARAMLAEQSRQLAAQAGRLDAMEARLAQTEQTSRALASASVPSAGGSAPPQGAMQVGQPPADSDRPPTVAVLDQQGSVVTRRGQLIAELGVDYTRSDRNRAIFRGVELIQSVLVGVFDINESRQDILTASGAVRYGVSDRFELGVRVPYLYRSDKLVTTPISGSTSNDQARTLDNSVNGSGIGDVELTARYQINNGGRNAPFLIANLQATVPTGRDPFGVRRDSLGVARQVATGAGFWGVTPSLTAILPTEPAVLFGTLGYTFNLGKDVNTRIPPVQIDHIEPGDQINISAGVGLALNERTSINFGYNHAWTFGTKTLTRRLDERTSEPTGEPFRTTSRDLQIGRFLFGVSHRFSDLLQINWTVEMGATEDAPDARTSLRLPFVF